jgi:hypothetical protein
MPQIFHRSTNTLSKLSVFGAVFFIGGLIVLVSLLYQSPYVTQAGVAREQPVPFSHEHHVRGLGIDCRYCHTSVEDSSFAGLPSAKTCMTCHSQVWTNAEILEPIRAAYRSGQPVHWTRVHALPQYVYFDHSIHIAKGVACTTCHGPVDRMPLMYQQNSLHMTWCLECHRHPEKQIGLKENVFQSNWTADPTGVPTEMQHSTTQGEKLMIEYHVKNARKMSDCYTCHR